MLDTGAFISAADGTRATLVQMEAARKRGLLYVSAHNYAEFYRGGARSAREARLVNQWRPQLLEVGLDEGKLAGELLAATGRDNSMDALVVAAAVKHAMDEIFTVDVNDIEQLCAAIPNGRRRDILVVDVR